MPVKLGSILLDVGLDIGGVKKGLDEIGRLVAANPITLTVKAEQVASAIGAKGAEIKASLAPPTQAQAQEWADKAAASISAEMTKKPVKINVEVNTTGAGGLAGISMAIEHMIKPVKLTFDLPDANTFLKLQQIKETMEAGAAGAVKFGNAIKTITGNSGGLSKSSIELDAFTKSVNLLGDVAKKDLGSVLNNLAYGVKSIVANSAGLGEASTALYKLVEDLELLSKFATKDLGGVINNLAAGIRTIATSGVELDKVSRPLAFFVQLVNELGKLGTRDLGGVLNSLAYGIKMIAAEAPKLAGAEAPLKSIVTLITDLGKSTTRDLGGALNNLAYGVKTIAAEAPKLAAAEAPLHNIIAVINSLTLSRDVGSAMNSLAYGVKTIGDNAPNLEAAARYLRDFIAELSAMRSSVANIDAVSAALNRLGASLRNAVNAGGRSGGSGVSGGGSGGGGSGGSGSGFGGLFGGLVNGGRSALGAIGDIASGITGTLGKLKNAIFQHNDDVEKHTMSSWQRLRTAGFTVFAIESLVNLGKGFVSFVTENNALMETWLTNYKFYLGSAEKAQIHLADTIAAGAKSGFDLKAFVTMDQQLTASHMNTKRLEQDILDLGAALKGRGTENPLQQISNIFTQIRGGNFGRAETALGQIGLSRDELQQMGLAFKGVKTQADIPQVIEATEKVIEERFGGLALAQSRTLDGMLTNLKNYGFQFKEFMTAPIADLVRDVIKPLADPETGFFGKKSFQANLQGFRDAVWETMHVVQDTVGSAFRGIGDLISGFNRSLHDGSGDVLLYGAALAAIGTIAITPFLGIITQAVGAVVSFTGVLTATPVIALAAPLIAIGAAIGLFVTQTADGAKAWKELTDGLSAGDSVWSHIGDLIGFIKDGIHLLVYDLSKGDIKQAFADLQVIGEAALLALANGFSEAGKHVFPAVGDLLGGVAKMVAEFIQNAFVWGGNLIISFANGIIAAAGAVINAIGQVIQSIADMIESHSPPKIGPLKNIGIWGTHLIEAWLEGMSHADFTVLSDLTKEIQSHLTSLGDVGEINRLGIIPRLIGDRQEIGKTLADMRAGLIDIDQAAQRLRATLSQEGPFIQQMAEDYLRIQDLQTKIDATQDDIDKKNEEIKSKEIEIKAIRDTEEPYKNQLQGIGVLLTQNTALTDMIKAQRDIATDAMTVRLQGLKDEHDSIQANIDAVKEQYQTQIDGLNESKQLIEDQIRLQTSQNDKQINHLDAQIAQLELADAIKKQSEAHGGRDDAGKSKVYTPLQIAQADIGVLQAQKRVAEATAKASPLGDQLVDIEHQQTELQVAQEKALSPLQQQQRQNQQAQAELRVQIDKVTAPYRAQLNVLNDQKLNLDAQQALLKSQVGIIESSITPLQNQLDKLNEQKAALDLQKQSLQNLQTPLQENLQLMKDYEAAVKETNDLEKAQTDALTSGSTKAGAAGLPSSAGLLSDIIPTATGNADPKKANIDTAITDLRAKFTSAAADIKTEFDKAFDFSGVGDKLVAGLKSKGKDLVKWLGDTFSDPTTQVDIGGVIIGGIVGGMLASLVGLTPVGVAIGAFLGGGIAEELSKYFKTHDLSDALSDIKATIIKLISGEERPGSTKGVNARGGMGRGQQGPPLPSGLTQGAQPGEVGETPFAGPPASTTTAESPPKLPGIAGTIAALPKWSEMFGAFIDSIGKAGVEFGKIFDSIGGHVSALLDSLQPLEPTFKIIASVLAFVGEKVAGLLASDGLPALVALFHDVFLPPINSAIEIIKAFVDGLVGLQNTVIGVVKIVGDLINGDWKKAWDDAKVMFTSWFDTGKKVIGDITEVFNAMTLGLLGKLGELVKGVWNALGWAQPLLDGMHSVASGIAWLVGKIIDAVNFVLGWIGQKIQYNLSDLTPPGPGTSNVGTSATPLGPPAPPSFSQPGSNPATPGLAAGGVFGHARQVTVGEASTAQHPEVIINTNSPDRNRSLALLALAAHKLGIGPATIPPQHLGGSRMGLGDFFGDAFDNLGGLTSDAFAHIKALGSDAIHAAASLVSKGGGFAWSKIREQIPDVKIGQPFQDLPSHLLSVLGEKMGDAIDGIFSSIKQSHALGAQAPVGVPQQVADWIAQAAENLGLDPQTWVDAISGMMGGESTYDPTAHGHDPGDPVPAPASDPVGLMQVKEYNFPAGMSEAQMMDPVTNIMQAIRYIIARYGGAAEIKNYYESGAWAASGGYNIGIKDIPDDGLYMLHAGEEVMPANPSGTGSQHVFEFGSLSEMRFQHALERVLVPYLDTIEGDLNGHGKYADVIDGFQHVLHDELGSHIGVAGGGGLGSIGSIGSIGGLPNLPSNPIAAAAAAGAAAGASGASTRLAYPHGYAPIAAFGNTSGPIPQIGLSGIPHKEMLPSSELVPIFGDGQNPIAFADPLQLEPHDIGMVHKLGSGKIAGLSPDDIAKAVESGVKQGLPIDQILAALNAKQSTSSDGTTQPTDKQPPEMSQADMDRKRAQDQAIANGYDPTQLGKPNTAKVSASGQVKMDQFGLPALPVDPSTPEGQAAYQVEEGRIAYANYLASVALFYNTMREGMLETYRELSQITTLHPSLEVLAERDRRAAHLGPTTPLTVNNYNTFNSPVPLSAREIDRLQKRTTRTTVERHQVMAR